MTAETQPIRRRGRPPQGAAATAPEATSEATPRDQRRIRPKISGAAALKLGAEERPGFVRRFVNNAPGRIQAMEDLGYAMVSDRAGAEEKRTDSLGTRISRHAGTTDRGEAMQTFLMETPVEEFNYGIEDREEARKPFEEAIRRSADPTGQVEGAYAPSVKSTLRN